MLPALNHSQQTPPGEIRSSRDTWDDALAIGLGVALTLAVGGYQFGQSNHTVYLLAALRQTDPHLLRQDWWTTATLQYHGVFTHLSAALMRWNLIEPVFFAGYLLLAVAWQVIWLAMVRALGGGKGLYLLSALLFYASAGGLGLGMYQFLQDSALLPSNIANVAMLAGIYAWMRRRLGWAGLWLGVAGLFHLNHAIVGAVLWATLSVWSLRDGWAAAHQGRSSKTNGTWRSWLLGSLTLMILSFVSVAPALQAIVTASGRMPLADFVQLYVRLRHPHHYDPSSWPWALWLSFLWPMPLAVLASRQLPPSRPLRQARRIFLFYLTLLLIALLGAGIWYASETLVQMSLYRFSIYPKLLSCIGAAFFIARRRKGEAPAEPHGWSRLSRRFALSGIALVVIILTATQGRGLQSLWLPTDDAPYLALCDWVRRSTPVDALFLVPPDEQAFRLAARRAIVVNFKGVPQLSGELPEWRRRLEAVLDMDLLELPRGMHATLAAIRQRYDALPPQHLAHVARQFDADYVITTHRVPTWDTALLHISGPYHLYARP